MTKWILIEAHNNEIEFPHLYDSWEEAYNAMYDKTLGIVQNGDEFYLSPKNSSITRLNDNDPYNKDSWDWSIFKLEV